MPTERDDLPEEEGVPQETRLVETGSGYRVEQRPLYRIGVLDWALTLGLIMLVSWLGGCDWIG